MNDRPKKKKRNQRPTASSVLRRLDRIDCKLNPFSRRVDDIERSLASLIKKLGAIELDLYRIRQSEEFRPRQRSWNPDD